jgi:hypothetical protein
VQLFRVPLASQQGASAKEIEMDLTALHLTPLGLLHTIPSVIVVVAAIAALIRDEEISPQSGIGRIYIWTLVLTCLTGLAIFRHGGIQPVVASPDAPIFKILYLGPLILFLIGAALQIQKLRGPSIHSLPVATRQSASVAHR